MMEPVTVMIEGVTGVIIDAGVGAADVMIKG